MKLTRADIVACEKELAKRSLAEFAKMSWEILEPATELKWGWALDSICEHLTAVTDGDIRRLLMNVPPGSMKSLLTSVIWPAWEWGPLGMPHLRYLGTSHKQDLAVRDNLKCRRLITSDWYQERWPTLITGDQNAKTKFENDKTGFREAMAFESMTGSRGDRVILDDPHSVDDAYSETKLKSAVRTFKEALPTRVNNDSSAIIIIMQRLNEMDVSAFALDLGYEHLCLPMRYEQGRSKWVIGTGDPRTTDNELMFPERFPEDTVKELEVSLGAYGAAGQLQQRPSPLGGGIIKGEWFRRYTVIPRFAFRMIFADTAQKTKEHNDYSVFQCWGKCAETGFIYLIDQIRGKWEAPELKRRATDFWQKHIAYEYSDWGSLRVMAIEDKASGTGLIQDLSISSAIPIRPIERDKDKLTRVLDVVSYIESGRVYIPEQAPFVADFVHECESFTPDDTHPHDDQIDPMCDAIKDMVAVDSVIDIWSKMA